MIMWAIKTPEPMGSTLEWSLRYSRKDATENFVRETWAYFADWKEARKDGYRAVKVKVLIEEVKP